VPINTPINQSNNMGTSLPCDDSMGLTAHGQQVSTTEATHEIQTTLRNEGTSQGTK
jgi:hypothetical protein